MESMERLELAITILLVVLVMVCVYIAVSWTLWRKKSKIQEWLEMGHDEGIQSSISRGFVPAGEEGVPKITITPVQPRPDVAEELSAVETDGGEEDLQIHEVDSHEVELGRLYFALQYDQQRSILRVRLIRGEDIPMERDISATYVGVCLLPLKLGGEDVKPYETSINVSFQECYDFHLTQSELAQQTLVFHICRYDRFSRKVIIGDVFLALAELGAQGIDITREVYLCRNIINSREAKQAKKRQTLPDSEEDTESKQKTKSKVDRSKNVGENAKKMWKIVQSAVRKGRFRGLSYSIPGQDSPFYWESMFSSGEGENVDYSLASPGKLGSGYSFSGPGPPVEVLPELAEQDDDIDEDVVTRGERSGSFLFPSKSDEEDDDKTLEREEERETLGPPLQISPAPEEYYTLVPITPFFPASPLTDHKPRDPTVSWHVPETFTSRGPDVVQALADTYIDPRIVTTANLRQNKIRQLPVKDASQTISTDSELGSLVRTDKQTRKTKRKHDEVKRQASYKKGRRKVTPPKHQKQKTHARKAALDGETEKREKQTETKKKNEKIFRTRAKVARTTSSSSEEDLDTAVRTLPFRKIPEGYAAKSEQSKDIFVFEAQDFEGPFLTSLKDRAHSAPNLSTWRGSINANATRREPRASVSMSDIKDSHIDSSDVSSDFDQ